MQPVRRPLLALALLVLAAPLAAQEGSHPVELHAFGSWSYGRTSANNLLGGTPEGNYRSTALAVNLARRIDERLSIHAQIDIEQEAEVELDFAFANYQLDDRLSLQIGQVKHPFGIYTEVFDVGTLRPFLDLPQGFYGPVGFAGESFAGVGASGTAELGAWTADYSLYGGGLTLREFATPERFYNNAAPVATTEQHEHETTRNVVGGRLVLRTPVRGLTLGGSAYAGTLDDAEPTRRTVYAGQVGFRSNRLTIESEIARHDQSDGERATGGYALAAFRLTPEWQVGAQYDDLTSRFAGVASTTVPSMQEHREVAFVVSRWLTRSFVIKTEYHHVRGNRFALPAPEELAPAIASGELQITSGLVRFGAQFAF